MTPETLSAAQARSLDITGLAFLHEQGSTVTRGFVVALEVDAGSWTLRLRDVEALNKSAGGWEPEADVEEYRGHVGENTFVRYDDGMLEISGYGMVTHVAPATADPWVDIDWPELDGYDGGPMSRGGRARNQSRRAKR